MARHHQVQIRKGVCAWLIMAHREEKPLKELVLLVAGYRVSPLDKRGE